MQPRRRVEACIKRAAAALFRQQPVTKIVAVGADPNASDSRAGWIRRRSLQACHRGDHIPAEVYDRLKGGKRMPSGWTRYEDAEAAEDAAAANADLSDALVALGREAAGLSPLTSVGVAK